MFVGGAMSLHKYTSVHYYEGANKGLKSKHVLKPSSKESGYAGTYKKGNIHVRFDFYNSIDLVIRNTPVYGGDGLIITCFSLQVPFSNRADEEHPRHKIFQKVPFDLYTDMNKKGVTTEQQRDVEESARELLL